MKKSLTILFLISLTLFMSNLYADDNQELYFIDAHSQIDHRISGIEVVLEQMALNNVKSTLLSLRGQRDWMEPVIWAASYPDKIIPLVRSKGKQYQNNTNKYYKEINRQIESEEFRGVAEILIYHAKKGHKAPEVEVRLNDERLTHLLDGALKNDWPLIIHIEFSALYGEQRELHMSDLEKLLSKHPTHPIVLIHMGQLEADEVQNLIEKHSNLYFLTSHSDPVTVNSSSQPWVNLFKFTGNGFKDEWENLFNRYPEKFIFALDNVWAEHWGSPYIEKVTYWKKALSKLPTKNAHLIAHGNAERLWKLK